MWQVIVVALQAVIQWALPRILSVAGVAVVSQTVYDPALNWIQNKISSSLAGLSADALAFLQFTGIPNAITIIFAAITLKIGMKAAKAALAKKGATDA